VRPTLAQTSHEFCNSAVSCLQRGLRPEASTSHTTVFDGASKVQPCRPPIV
jgi:hypothetical protein